MNGGKIIKSVGKELAARAPTDLVFKNWRLWYFCLVIVVISLTLVFFGIYLSMTFLDWAILSRFGVLLVVLGSYLIGRPIWRRRFKSRFAIATIFTDGKLSDEQLTEYILERTDIWFFFVGFFIAAVGSVIWGFADLINCLAIAEEYKCAISAFNRE